MRIIYSSLLICMYLWGCHGQNAENSLPVVDLRNAVSGECVKISEILDNVRLIRLETRPEVLLPGFFYAWVGDKYIVTLGQEEIHLFTTGGKYIRKIAQQGRGPEEYLYLMGYCVDEQTDRLYLVDNDKRMCVIDLEEGKILQKVALKSGTRSTLLLTGKDTIVYISQERVDDEKSYDICRIKTDGTFIDGISGSGETGGAESYLGRINDTLRYKMALCDTLFRIENSIKIPYCHILTGYPYSKSTGEGIIAGLAFENKDLFLVNKQEIKVEEEENVTSTNIKFLGYYIFEKSDFSLRTVPGFYLDILDYTYPNPYRFPFMLSGKRAYQNINVLKFKMILEDKLDSPLIADSLKILYRELAEDDNSLLLVGDIKE